MRLKNLTGLLGSSKCAALTIGSSHPNLKDMGNKVKSRTVVLQEWEESEKGWGVRPDGWTLHIDMDDWKLFVERQNRRQKEYFDKALGPNVTPAEYTRTSGQPTPVTVSGRVYHHMLKKADDCGIYGSGNVAPSLYKIIPDEKVIR